MRNLIQLTLAATLALSASVAFAEDTTSGSLTATDEAASFDRDHDHGDHGGGWGHGPGYGGPANPGGGHGGGWGGGHGGGHGGGWGGGHGPGPGYPPPPPPYYPPAPSYPSFDRVGACTVERDGGYSTHYVIYDYRHYRIDEAWSYAEAMDDARRADYEGRCNGYGGGGYGNRTECRINVNGNVFVGYGNGEWEATSDARSQCLRVYNNSYVCNDPSAVCRFY